MAQPFLGSSISMSGFRDMDDSEKSVANKILAHYDKRFAELCEGEVRIKVTLKKIHKKEKSEKYEIHARLADKRRHFEAHVIERNLFVALDLVLRKIEHEISK